MQTARRLLSAGGAPYLGSSSVFHEHVAGCRRRFGCASRKTRYPLLVTSVMSMQYAPTSTMFTGHAGAVKPAAAGKLLREPAV